MANGATQQKLAVDSGVWPLYRFDPRRIAKGEPPMHLDYGRRNRSSPSTCATSRGSASSSAAIPERFRGFLKERKRRPVSATRCTSSSRASPCHFLRNDRREASPAVPERKV
jgi:hypothetical protein